MQRSLNLENNTENDDFHHPFGGQGREEQFRVFISSLMHNGKVELAVSQVLSRYALIPISAPSLSNKNSPTPTGGEKEYEIKYVPSYETYELLVDELAKVGRFDLIEKIFQQVMKSFDSRARVKYMNKKRNQSSTSQGDEGDEDADYADEYDNNDVSSDARLRPTESFLRKMLHLAGKTRNLAQFDKVLYFLESCGIKKDEQIYLMMVKHYVRFRDTESAVELLRELKDYQLSASSSDQMYALLLTLYFRSQKTDLAWQLFDQYKREYQYPSPKVSMTIVRHVAVQMHDVDRAKKIVLELPNGVIHTEHFIHLIHGCMKLGRYKEAFEAIDLMKKRGLVPTFQTYSPLLSNAALTGDLKKMDRILDLMIGDGLVRDKNDINVVAFRISGLVRREKVNEAENLYFSMIDMQVVPKLAVFVTLIQYFLQVRHYNKARRIINDYKQMAGSLHPHIYSVMIYDKFRLGDKVGAFSLLKEMNKQTDTPRTSEHYRYILNGAARFGTASDLYHIVDSMRKKGVEPSYKHLLMIIAQLCLYNSLEEARVVFDSITEKYGYNRSSSLYTIIVGYHLKFGEVEIANEYYDKMIAEGIKPNIVFYQTAIHYLSTMELTEDIEKVYQQIRENKLQPNERTLQSMMKVSFANDDLEGAFNYYRQMTRDHSMIPYPTLIHQLYHRFLDNGDLERAGFMIEELNRGGEFVAGPKLYDSLIEAYDKQGMSTHKAVEHLRMCKIRVCEEYGPLYGMEFLKWYRVPVDLDHLPHKIRVANIRRAKKVRREMLKYEEINADNYYEYEGYGREEGGEYEHLLYE